MTRIGFVGAGQMGEPMVERLLAAGHEVVLHVRRPEARERFAAAGARVVATSREAATGSPVVLACVFSDAQLVEVAAGPDGLLAGLGAGAVLASHVTGSAAALAALAAQVPEAHLVDAPVSGVADDIRSGTLTVLLGGAPEPVEAVAAVVTAYASPVLRTGALGSALSIKLVNNVLFAAHAQLAAEAVGLGRALGVEPILLVSALAQCSGRSYAVDTLTRLPDLATFERLAGPFLRKDVAACEHELEVLGQDAGLLGRVVREGPLQL